ncbi:Uma2 family endonuclease [Laspinema palackyanum]|uniref:Uma2 family endonuclease n=1 Tax=Laspinema palackyanum TaxID=3231601 RepID=UPI00345DFF09|nr:Uma2 family endonuclease [Laspinema sp. D2c]
MLATTPTYTITWEKLPDDFVLPDDPVDHINQPTLAVALSESLHFAGKHPKTALTTTNYAICATLNGQFVVKAPDWAYIPHITVDLSEVNRSYTPRLQGEIPAIVLEFFSEIEGEEYSIKETYPPGKFYYYEQILQVPSYGIFDIETGTLELYRLGENKRYKLESANEGSRFWIPEMQLFLGVWQGKRNNWPGYWLRWWDEDGNLLLWGTERLEQEQQRAERLAAQLRAAGIEPEE